MVDTTFHPALTDAPAGEHRPLGQMLIDEGLIDLEELDRALAFQKDYGGRLGSILLRFGAVSEEKLLEVLSRQLDLSVIAAAELPVDPTVFAAAIERSGYSVEWWIDQEALPWLTPDGSLHCLARDPLMTSLQEFVSEAFAPTTITWHLGASNDLDRALDSLRRVGQGGGAHFFDEVGHLRELAEEAPVVELVQSFLSQAFNERASDLHIEPEERNFHVRFRIDGVLQNRLSLLRERFDAIASRIKLICGMDIAERRLPQDGRLTVRIGGEEVDVRVSALPGTWGKSLVFAFCRNGDRASGLARSAWRPGISQNFRR